MRGTLRSLTTGNRIRVEFYNDMFSYLIAFVYVDTTDIVNIEIYKDLKELTVSEMRELWAKLKIGILPSNFMEEVRVNVLTHLQKVDRVDLVAVCLDSADPMEDKIRL